MIMKDLVPRGVPDPSGSWDGAGGRRYFTGWSAGGRWSAGVLAVCVATGDNRLYANILLTVGYIPPSP